MTTSRKTLLALSLCLSGLATSQANAQDFPFRAVTVVTPFAAGNGPDAVLRLGAHLESLAGVTMQHVPYREVSQLFSSVAAGDVAWSFGSIPSSQGAYKAGKLRYIAIAAPKRIPQLPEVPTVAESGGPAQLDVNSFVVLVAPRGIAAPVRVRIQEAVDKALHEADILARFGTFAFGALAWSAEEIARQAAIKSRTYEELVRRANISLE